MGNYEAPGYTTVPKPMTLGAWWCRFCPRQLSDNGNEVFIVWHNVSGRDKEKTEFILYIQATASQKRRARVTSRKFKFCDNILALSWMTATTERNENGKECVRRTIISFTKWLIPAIQCAIERASRERETQIFSFSFIPSIKSARWKR